MSLIPAFTNDQRVIGIADAGELNSMFYAYHNSVLIGGTATGDTSSWAFAKPKFAGSASTHVDRNNIFFNARSGGTGSHFAAGRQVAGGSLSSDNNVYVGTGATTANFMDFGTTGSGTPLSFADWQSSTGGDAHSQAGNPGGSFTTAMFVNPSAGDLHIVEAGNPLVSNTGTPVAGVTTDFDGENRNPLTPDVGADEFGPPPLQVSALVASATGFTAQFACDLDPTSLNLYDQGGSLGAADVTLTGATTGEVRGSVVVDPGMRKITFIKTGGLLAPDMYTVRLLSGASAFKDTLGQLLDGNGDGVAGDNYTGNFTIGEPAVGGVTLSIPDFTRGYGQAVNVPASSAGLPITISNAQGVKSATFALNYEPTLLSITGATIGEGLTGNVTFDMSVPGVAQISVTSASGLSSTAGLKTLVKLSATVPANAPYGQKHPLDLANVQILDTSTAPAALPAIDDDGIHIAAYFGDANGSQSYNAPDATLAQRLIVGSDTGFASYQLADPYLIADISGNGQVQSDDVTQIQRAIVGLSTPNIPPHPGLSPAATGGPDPIVSVPQNLTASLGETITVPVELLVTEPTGIELAGADIAIAYDASALELTDANVGQLLIGFGLSVNTTTPGLIRLSLTGSPLDLTFNSEGVLATLQFSVLAGFGTTSKINLLQSAAAQQTALYDSAGRALTLAPAPTNGDHDEVDGWISILGNAQPAAAWELPAVDMAFDGEDDFTAELIDESVALN